jgi:signal transduction histidine kinase
VNATRRAGALAAADGVDLAVKEPAGDAPIVVAVDIDRLEQVLHILIDNASRHAPNGSVVTVALSASAASGKARLAVSDDGPGIPPEDRERIFEPFTRVRGEKRSSGGTGLGLAIARQLATDHEAELRVADTAPPGATIELILPLVRQA